jgi:quercetin dioxygenase-like cupin family protein
MKIIQLENRDKVKVTMEGAKDVYKQLAISKADDSPAYSFRVFTLGPEGYTPFHQHNFEHLNYVIQGEGVLVNESGEYQEFKKGDFAIVLANEKHQFRNRSKENLFIMICAVPKEYE